ncbi:Protoporphyrinogen oxidase [Abortiporus biennis]
MPPSNIAIIGGGLSGLSATFHLARRFPNSRITLLEKSNRLGGWVRSERVNVKDSQGKTANVLLEAGPRTLRPNGNSVLELINLLHLDSSLLLVPKSSPAAQNRFLHIENTKGLTAIPSSLPSLLSSSLAKVLLPAVLLEPFRKDVLMSANIGDASVDAFLSSRFGEDFATTFGSALVHGIYAADSRDLSVKAAFPSLWELAKLGNGSIISGAIRKTFSRKHTPSNVNLADYELGNLPNIMKGVSVYSFKDGMEALVRALEAELARKGNVHVLKGVAVDSIKEETEHTSFLLNTTSGTIPASHIVSSLPLSILDSILGRSSNTIPTAARSLPQTLVNPSSSVTVVNVVFPPSSQQIHPPGFGYLVPRSKSPSIDGNSDIEVDGYRLLGTVFDSCALEGQDEYPTGSASNGAKFTKLTMMLRAPYTSHHPLSTSSLLSLLNNHLSPDSPLPEPVLIRINNLVNCIPTPTVGHLERMQELRKSIGKGTWWNGRLELIGAGVGGVSVPDCIERGRTVGRAWL